jgi:hypothetical protein
LKLRFGELESHLCGHPQGSIPNSGPGRERGRGRSQAESRQRPPKGTLYAANLAEPEDAALASHNPGGFAGVSANQLAAFHGARMAAGAQDIDRGMTRSGRIHHPLVATPLDRRCTARRLRIGQLTGGARLPRPMVCSASPPAPSITRGSNDSRSSRPDRQNQPATPPSTGR